MRYEMAVFNLENLPTKILPPEMTCEISQFIHSVMLQESNDGLRSMLSSEFRNKLKETDWNQDTNLLFEPAKDVTLHYLKNKISLQISWRHYEKVGTEILKLQTDYTDERIVGGVLICVSEKLMEVTNKAFQGSISMEKMISYLDSVRKTIQVPLVIYGLLP